MDRPVWRRKIPPPFRLARTIGSDPAQIRRTPLPPPPTRNFPSEAVVSVSPFATPAPARPPRSFPSLLHPLAFPAAAELCPPPTLPTSSCATCCLPHLSSSAAAQLAFLVVSSPSAPARSPPAAELAPSPAARRCRLLTTRVFCPCR
ncbi:hypothetical protein DAI22_11g030200 [Oryza sativa Japonica Group]|nr:hypothetical protein DAI22_11g030200 [Oryza sativa Japonica Group]